MKKKIFLMLAVMAMLVCIFAVSVNAEVSPERVQNLTMGMTEVTLADGTPCQLYDSEGNTLCYYKDANGSLKSVKTNELVFSIDADNKLAKISLQDGTELSTTYAQNANKIVVLNLRETTISDFRNDNMFKNSNNGLQYIFMPDSIVNLIGYAFGKNNTLRGCYFSEESPLAAIADNTFLQCTNLRDFYMPRSVTSLGASAFSSCASIYFINNYSELGNKPSVYYFPQGINTLKTETLKFCYKINTTIVFDTALTGIVGNAWTLAFNDSTPRNVVFLGNFTSFSASNQVNNQTFYFANKNTVPFTVTNNGSNNAFYFCKEGTNHLVEKAISTGATCESPKMTANYCFCGTIVGTPVTEGEALGHRYEGAVTYEFTSLVVGGKKCTACLNNCGTFAEETLKPIFDDYGYSVTTFSDKKALVNGYNVETSLLAIYENQNGVKVNFGFAFNRADNFTDGEVTLDSFAINAPINRNNGEIVFAAHEFRITYDSDEQLSANIIVAAYVVEIDAEGNEEASFINRTFDDGVNGFEAVSYNKFAQ